MELKQIGDAIEQMAGAFETFKADVERRFDQIDTRTSRPGIGMETRPGGDYSPEQRGVTLAQRRALAEFVRRGIERMPPELRTTIVQVTSPGNGSEGIVPWLLPRIIEIAQRQAPLLGLVQSITPGNWPAKVLLSDGNAVGSEWVDELTPRNQTAAPLLRSVDILPGELSALPQVTQWAVEDLSFDVEAWVVREVARRFATALELAVIAGDGTHKPKGMLAGPAPVATADGARAFGTLQYIASGQASTLPTTPQAIQDKLLDVTSALDVRYRANARWVMSPTTLATLRKVRDSEHRPLLMPALTAAAPDTLMGFPVVEAQNWPEIAAGVFPLAFGDFQSGYTLARSPELRITRDEITAPGIVKVYVRLRTGGAVVDSNAIKLMKIAAS